MLRDSAEDFQFNLLVATEGTAAEAKAQKKAQERQGDGKKRRSVVIT